MSPQFTWSDAWLLFAVALAATRGKVTLKDVIACGDAIEHAIFTPAELRRGFAKLIASGHVTRSEYFDVSPEVRDIIARTEKKRMAMSTLQRHFEAFLAAAPYPAGDPRVEDPEWPFPELTDAVVDQAVQVYQEEFRRRARHEP